MVMILKMILTINQLQQVVKKDKNKERLKDFIIRLKVNVDIKIKSFRHTHRNYYQWVLVMIHQSL